MKKILLLFIPILIFAKSFLISNIPLPKTYVQNLDTYTCNDECLREFLDKGMVFSFMAHANKQLADKQLDETRMIYISLFNLGTQGASQLRIAMLLPYKIIGRYALSTTDAVFAYLMATNHSFELKTYKLQTQSREDIQQAIDEIKQDKFNYIIAPLTQKGVHILEELQPQIYTYIPTIHKDDIQTTSAYIIYGGIDYKAQSNILLKEAVSPLVLFYDTSIIGRKLGAYQKMSFLRGEYLDEGENISFDNSNKTVIQFMIPKRTTNLEHQLKENKKIDKGSFFIDTPIVKSGMIMSQLTLYDVNVTNILSTQINYDPLLLSMTQYRDRKKMIVANSITKHNDIITQTNDILGNDIVYDWINYTTTVGIDYFFSLITNEQRKYDIELKDNQMLYDIELIKPSYSKFVNYQKEDYANTR